MNISKYCIYLWCLSSLGGCIGSHHFYAPNEGMMLVLEEQKDLKASLGSSALTSRLHNASLQIAYSPIKHIGLQSSMYYQSGRVFTKNSFTDGTIKSVSKVNDFIGSGAVGAYHKFALKQHRSVLLDIYTGYARGSNLNFFQNGSHSKIYFDKIYVQGGILIQDSLMGVRLTFKKGVLDFEEIVANGKLVDRHLKGIEEIIAHDHYNFTEVSIRANHKFKKLNLFATFNLLWADEAKENLGFSSFGVQKATDFDNITTVMGVLIDI